MAKKSLLLPISDANLIGRFEIKGGFWFDPFVCKTVDGYYLIDDKMKAEVKKYCNDNNIPVDIDALTTKWPNEVIFDTVTIP